MATVFFAVLGLAVTPSGAGLPQANVGRPCSTLEQIAARRKEIEDARHNLEHEEAKLDTNVEPHARIRARDVGRRIETDEEGFPLLDRPSQYVTTAALFARQLPQAATPSSSESTTG